MNELDSVLEECSRHEWPPLVGAVARMVGDLHAAEEIVQDVLVTALGRWPFSGVPDRPGAWLMTAARNRARNHLRDASRRRARLESAAALAVAGAGGSAAPEAPAAEPPIGDERLRLVFVCCHPGAVRRGPSRARPASGGGALDTGSRPWLPATRAHRRPADRPRQEDARRCPGPVCCPGSAERLPGVLRTIYLVFNEGHTAATGLHLTRPDLCVEALRLGRLLAELLPDEAEVHGLLALMELQASRLATRVDARGSLVVLADQDRARWDRTRIEAGQRALTLAMAQGGRHGPIALQASIAACHAEAGSWEDTEWPRIVSFYDTLLEVAPSSVVLLNRAVALGMAQGPAAALSALDAVLASGALAGHHLLWATRADLLRRQGRWPEAIADYERAMSLASNQAEHRHLAPRRSECIAEAGNAG